MSSTPDKVNRIPVARKVELIANPVLDWSRIPRKRPPVFFAEIKIRIPETIIMM